MRSQRRSSRRKLESVVTESSVAPKEDESVWRKVCRKPWHWLRQYTILNALNTLIHKECSYDTLEKFFAMMVLMNALAFAMTSSMATAFSYEEMGYWYDDCRANDALRKCVRNFWKKNNNNEDVCSRPIRNFQNMVTVTHELLALSLFVAAAMYLYVMAYMTNKIEDKDKEHLSDEQLAARRKERRQTWALFAVVALGVVTLTIVALIYYQHAFNEVVTLKFIVFAWQKGEHCRARNVRSMSGAMGTWLVGFGLFFVCSVVSAILGRIRQVDKPKLP